MSVYYDSLWACMIVYISLLIKRIDTFIDIWMWRYIDIFRLEALYIHVLLWTFVTFETNAHLSFDNLAFFTQNSIINTYVISYSILQLSTSTAQVFFLCVAGSNISGNHFPKTRSNVKCVFAREWNAKFFQ